MEELLAFLETNGLIKGKLIHFDTNWVINMLNRTLLFDLVTNNDECSGKILIAEQLPEEQYFKDTSQSCWLYLPHSINFCGDDVTFLNRVISHDRIGELLFCNISNYFDLRGTSNLKKFYKLDN